MTSVSVEKEKIYDSNVFVASDSTPLFAESVAVYTPDIYEERFAYPPHGGGHLPHRHPPPRNPPHLILETGDECAFFGCLFSWIPVVGILTCLLNYDAPPTSRRAYWARHACMISSIIIFINIVFWFSWSSSDKCNLRGRDCR